MTDTEVTMPVEASGDALAKREKKPANQNKNKGRKEPRIADTFDPNEPIVKPAEVTPPDETEHNAAVQGFKDKMEAGEEKIKAIDAEIEVLKGIREKQNAAAKGLQAELRAHRDKVKAVQSEKDSLSEQLELLSEKKKQNAERMKGLRKQLTTTDASVIDEQVAKIERRLETETTDLKTEKDLVYQMKKLTAQKDAIKEFAADQAKVKEKEEQHQQMYLKLKAKKEELQALRVVEREKIAQLDAAKAGAVEGQDGAQVGNANTKIVELMGTKTEVIEQNKKYRASIKDLSVKMKIKFAEFREYQRAMAAYKDKMDKVDYLKRRAEQQERYEKVKEERKEKDKKRAEDKKRLEARMLAVANGSQIYVGGLALRVDETALRTLMQPFGTVTDVTVVRDNDTELSRGFSFVTFEDDEMAGKAIKDMNRKEIKSVCPPHGRLSIKFAEKSRQQKDWEKANANKITKKVVEAAEDPKEASGVKVEADADADAAEQTAEEGQVENAADAPAEGQGKEGGKKKGGKKKWEASREEWTKESKDGEATEATEAQPISLCA